MPTTSPTQTDRPIAVEAAAAAGPMPTTPTRPTLPPTTPPPALSKLVTILGLRLPTSDPANWPRARKWRIVAVLTACNVLPGFCSTVYLPGVPSVRDDLHTSDVLVNLTLSLFILFNGVGPIFFSAASDTMSRRKPVYLFALALFSAASLACYFAESVGVLIALRCLQSVGASAALSIAAGSVSDMFYLSERGAAVGAVSAGSAVGALTGPVLGGVMTQAIGWRATFLLSAGLGAALLFAQLLAVPESYRFASIWGPMQPSPPAPTSPDAAGSEELSGAASERNDSAPPPAGNAFEAEHDDFRRSTNDETDAVQTGEPDPSGASNPLKKVGETFKVLTLDYVCLCAVAGSFPFA
ncbi:hypothetical protein HK405_014188, partial [Cladochytrium tenue]